MTTLVHTKYARTLQKGDLCVISYSNYLQPAIFKEFRPAGNSHFYLINRYKIESAERRIKAGKKPYIDFFNRHSEECIAKIDPKDLDLLVYDEYKQFKDLLTLNGYI